MDSHSYHQLRAILGLDASQSIAILSDNARLHSSPHASTSQRRRKSRRCTKKRRSKSPPCRWDAVKEYAPSMPAPRSPSSNSESKRTSCSMPLRQPVRMNSFGDSEDLIRMTQARRRSRPETKTTSDKKDCTPTPPRRLLMDTKRLFPKTNFSSHSKSFEEIWQLLDDMADLPVDPDANDDCLERQSQGILQVS
ncbi:hypothetical protein MPSEU_000849400 [Mayamaea pseudoterrestris]|nr:hypothetical protein MPSEU_000849400 [Mayamaea pseudoterrestris]